VGGGSIKKKISWEVGNEAGRRVAIDDFVQESSPVGRGDVQRRVTRGKGLEVRESPTSFSVFVKNARSVGPKKDRSGMR